ncbi:MAG: toxin-antitoxin system HicB family antitoxin [Streptosporangiaceae bacterium]
MDLSEYVASLRAEMAMITRFAGDDVARAAEMLTEAMESSVRLTMLEALSAAAAEITTRLDGAVVDVRLAGSDADFVVTMTNDEPFRPPTPPTPPTPPGAEAADDMTRVTLRLSEPLKARVEAAAGAAGVSVNAWLIRAISQALDTPPGRDRPGRSRGPGQRYTGFARG